MPACYKKYFIAFIEVIRRYAWMKHHKSPVRTLRAIEDFLDQMHNVVDDKTQLGLSYVLHSSVLVGRHEYHPHEHYSS